MKNNEELEKKVSVFDVAIYILDKKIKITTYKLHKLLYYCQAWSLVFEEKPLFEEKFYAWANGPVCKEIYKCHAGQFSIESSDLNKGNISNLSEEQIETIDMVLKSYGKFSGQELSDLTHSETPWIEARKGLSIGERGENEISLELMAEYYSDLYSKQQIKSQNNE